MRCIKLQYFYIYIYTYKYKCMSDSRPPRRLLCVHVHVRVASRVWPIYFSLKKTSRKNLTKPNWVEPNWAVSCVHYMLLFVVWRYIIALVRSFAHQLAGRGPDGLGGSGGCVDERLWQRTCLRENCTTRRFVVNFLTIIKRHKSHLCTTSRYPVNEFRVYNNRIG